MGQQTNKVIKRRRRVAYLERLKQKAKEAAVVKPKVRRTPVRKVSVPVAITPDAPPLEQIPAALNEAVAP